MGNGVSVSSNEVLIWIPKLSLEQFVLQNYWEEVVIEMEAAYFQEQCMVEGLSRQLGEKNSI